ncbi:MAG TPA: TIGR01841 family phasin [Paucimonas sp.]|nr:TIGR01841 family phasin [Paucimonas sp.]HJW55265.1 TIGR01841 family phasin [Burkholderiaceae bacterium]
MFNFPEQFSAATKTTLNAQVDMLTSFANKTYESMEQIVNLNMNTMKASLADSAATAKQLLSANDPQTFLSLSAAQIQPNAQKALSYGRHLVDIAANVQAELNKAADQQFIETNRKVVALVDDVVKNAPAGSENAIALMKSAIGNASAGYEQLTKTRKQAADVLEANVAAAVNQFTQVAEKVASRTRK